MGTPQPKSDETLSLREPGLAGGTGSDLKADPAVTSSEDETSESRVRATDSGEHNKDAQLASDYNGEDFSGSPIPRNEQLNDGLGVELPQTQVMDRAGDSTGPDPNRIPAHVFDRTKSAAPEWSLASNESLFSIHMGNMSFTRDQINWMYKSGELGFPIDGQLSGQSIEIPGTPQRPLPPPNMSTDPSLKTGNGNQGLGATEAAAAETMREVIKENENDGDDSDQEKKPPRTRPDPRAIAARHSDDSSIKSFAFPILTGEEDKNGSLNGGKRKQKKQYSQPQTPKTGAEPKAPPAESEQEFPKSETPKLTKISGLGRWFSCFSCCSFCSGVTLKGP